MIERAQQATTTTTTYDVRPTRPPRMGRDVFAPAISAFVLSGTFAGGVLLCVVAWRAQDLKLGLMGVFCAFGSLTAMLIGANQLTWYDEAMVHSKETTVKQMPATAPTPQAPRPMARASKETSFRLGWHDTSGPRLLTRADYIAMGRAVQDDGRILHDDIVGSGRVFGRSDQWTRHVRRQMKDRGLVAVEAGVTRVTPWGRDVLAGWANDRGLTDV